MKFATQKNGTRDGKLLLVSKDATRCIEVADLAPHLQYALDHWHVLAPKLESRYQALNAGTIESKPLPNADEFLSPLPRAYEWVDGSAYINHILLVRKARNAQPPATLETDPLVYQGGSGTFLAPTDPIPMRDEAWGVDFESEVCVVLGDTPMGTDQSNAEQYIKLVMLANDVTLRNLIPKELEKGFGFFTSKPSTAFSPLALTPDELGAFWQGGRLYLNVQTKLNGTIVGDTAAGPEMHFSFYDLIKHICQTRGYTAGTILGSGTVSNVDESAGISCLAERRTREQIAFGKAETPFLKENDEVEINAFVDGQSLFGSIKQKVKKI
jgi:fumarylacetoacetate (FAA) hydrolase